MPKIARGRTQTRVSMHQGAQGTSRFNLTAAIHRKTKAEGRDQLTAKGISHLKMGGYLVLTSDEMATCGSIENRGRLGLYTPAQA